MRVVDCGEMSRLIKCINAPMESDKWVPPLVREGVGDTIREF
jgi:hypothetical protein